MGKNLKMGISIALCVLLVLSFTACGSGNTADTTSSTAVQTSNTTSAASQTAPIDPTGKYDTTVTLTAARSLDTSVKFDTSNPLCKSLEENLWQSIYKEYLNVDINYIWTAAPDQYNAKWNTSIASGNIPDIAVVDATIYSELLEAGQVEDMTGYFNDYAIDAYKQWNINENNAAMSYMTFDGKLYGLPITGLQPDGGSLFFIRQDWLDKTGKSVPKTIDELVDVAQSFKDAKLGGDKTYGIFMGSNVNSGAKGFFSNENSVEGFLNGFGAYYNIWKDDGTGKLVYSTIQPEMKPALLKLQDLYKKGILSQDFVTKTDGKDIGAGMVGITYGRFYSPLTGILTSIEKEDAKWKALEPPTLDGSKPVIQGSSVPLGYIFVRKGCEHPDAAVKLVNLKVKTEAERLKYSVNGIDAEKIDEESRKLTESGIYTYQYMFAPEISPPWKNLVDYELCSAALTTGNTSDLEKGVAAHVYYPIIKKGDTSGKAYDLVFGVDSVYKVIKDLKESNRILVDADQTLQTKTQISSSETLVTALDSAILKVIMGDDISVFDNAVEAWKKGGGDAITNELNEWYANRK